MKISTLCGCRTMALLAMVLFSAGSARAAFMVEAGTGGKALANFSSLGHSVTAAGSSAAGTSVVSSAFGNPANATGPDQYTFSYTPGTNADNTAYAALDVLGNSAAVDADGLGPVGPVYANVPQLATGLAGGGTGLYNVYFTTLTSTNVNAAGSQFVTTHDLGSTALNPVNLNDGGTGPDTTAPGVGAHVGGANNMWLLIAAAVPMTAGNTYTVTQTANGPTFVSQRSHGVMWEYVGPIVPEPATVALAGFGLVAIGVAARRRTA